MNHAYWGKAFENSSIESAIERCGLSFEVMQDEKSLVREVVRHLTGGHVVGSVSRPLPNGAQGRLA